MLTRLLAVALFCCGLLLADTTTETWDDSEWNSDWTGNIISATCDTSYALAYTTSNCHDGDGHCFYGICVGRNDALSGRAEWSGTWETLGVDVGHTVSTVQMTDAETRCVTYSTCAESTIGPFELRDSGDSLVATLWSGRTASGAEGDYTTEGSQSAQSCGSVCASSSSIQLWIGWVLDTANNASATCDFYIDELDISIEHTAPPSNYLNRMMITKARLGWRGGRLQVLESVTTPLREGD